MAINVFLVEDHDIGRQELQTLLEQDPEIKITGEACGEDAFAKLQANVPDVLLIDLTACLTRGPEWIRLLKKEIPSLRILILANDNKSQPADLINAGVNGCILKSSEKDELVFAIKRIVNKGIYIGSEFYPAVLWKDRVNGELTNKQSGQEFNITEKEMDVLRLIARGLTNVEIARQLFTSVRTIETRRKNLLEKTGTSNTATLIRFTVLKGLIN